MSGGNKDVSIAVIVEVDKAVAPCYWLTRANTDTCAIRNVLDKSAAHVAIQCCRLVLIRRDVNVDSSIVVKVRAVDTHRSLNSTDAIVRESAQ